MEKVRRQIDPALLALIRERLQRDEIVLGWNEHASGEVTVRLMSQELRRVYQSMSNRLNKGAGYGRVLSFRRHVKSVDVSGSWQLDLVSPPWPALVRLPPEFPDTLAVASRRLIAPRPSWALPLTPHFSADTLDSSPHGRCTEVGDLCGQRLTTLMRPQ